jgi:thymidylate kinase
MNALHDCPRTTLISFSGIDGSGKSTQIEMLSSHLRENGLRVVPIRFWDDIATMTILRENAGHTLFRGDKGVGTISAPINRRDKNVDTWLMTVVRLLLYFVDAISVRVAVEKALKSRFDVVIFDRYTYDELANLRLRNPVIRAYVNMIMRIASKPHISYLLDADPVKARARKPEYPLEFLNTNRQSYLDLSKLVGGMTVVPTLAIEDVGDIVLKRAMETISSRTLLRESRGIASPNDAGIETAGVNPQQNGRADF